MSSVEVTALVQSILWLGVGMLLHTTVGGGVCADAGVPIASTHKQAMTANTRVTTTSPTTEPRVVAAPVRKERVERCGRVEGR